MSGVQVPGMLSAKTFIAKVIGMATILSSGLNIGK